MSRKSVVIIGLVVIVVIASIWFFAAEKMSKIQTRTDTENNTLESEQVEETGFTISATKVGKRSEVFKVTLSGQTEKIFEFEEQVAADASGNYWTSLPANVALSPDSKQLAYIDIGGLKILDLGDRSKTVLIEKVGETQDPIKGYKIWNPTMPNVHSIHKPRWSSDGKYLSFLAAQYEGFRVGVIDIREHRVQFSGMSRKQAWSRTGHKLLLVSTSSDCDYCEDKISIWDVESGKETVVPIEMLARIETEYLVK